ncbi:MAG TPA: site-specific DNA-methyltransferase [Geobacteraceae bacterium]
MAKAPTKIAVETLTHDEATRKNIPTAEHQSIMHDADKSPVCIAYERRNRDLDPQLVWRGKDEQDWSDLVVHAPPLYIQEKVHPKVLIDDLLRRSKADQKAAEAQFDLFADFNGLPSESAKTEFYQHDAHWANRMILGDSLQVMASLAEREGLRGKVQCIYFDPPYGIKFNSNFQWSTTSRTVDDGNVEHITREPEQVKAFRDTWRDGIHSYLTYARDRITAARDLLAPSGSVFVQIGDANVHRLRALLDEVFGEDNFVSQISVRKTATPSLFLDDNHFFILWYSKSRDKAKFRKLLREKPLFEWVTETRGGSWGVTIDEISRPLTPAERRDPKLVPDGGRVYALSKTTSAGASKEKQYLEFEGKQFSAGNSAHWKTTIDGMKRVNKSGRLEARGGPPWFRKYHIDSPFKRMTNVWDDTSGKSTDRIYVVQTEQQVVERCLLMSSDPGDLVLDPTCGSGTTAYVAEQWGRRWITIDTSRVALALARARIMGARYPYYLLADSKDGQQKEGEITRSVPSSQPTRGDIRHGFVYERIPYVTLGSIGNNSEIDVIWEKFQEKLEPLRQQVNQALGKGWEEWEIPSDADAKWSEAAKNLHALWWEQRIARQKEIDASIAAKAEHEYLYDKPYEDKKKVRVAGPFTVETLSPHRVLTVGADDELIDTVAEQQDGYGKERDFVQMILENLKTAGVQQAHKEDKITFASLTPWPGDMVCAEGSYEESGAEKRAAIFIGPEFGTVSRPDLVQAAREAGDAGFDVLIACAFNYDAHSSEFDKLGRIPVLKARMNADLHMADDLKNTGKGNLFVIFGEPDIDIRDVANGQIQVKVNGVDVFHPNTGEVRSDGAEGIACWFIDTDYNEESFFVRHAYFLGANDPYKALKTTLKAEINEDAWATLNSDTSRPFDKPKTGRIAVKVINHLGDEVMKVFRV